MDRQTHRIPTSTLHFMRMCKNGFRYTDVLNKTNQAVSIQQEYDITKRQLFNTRNGMTEI